MKMPIVTVFDKKTALYDKPFVIRHVGDAIRDWDTLRKDQNTRFGKNPEDFDLFQIADYDDLTGEITMHKPHLHLASGV